MVCVDCKQYDREARMCQADFLIKEYPLDCLFKMVLQELRISNFGDKEEDDDKDDWKKGIKLD